MQTGLWLRYLFSRCLLAFRGIQTIESAGQIIASYIFIDAESVGHGDWGRIGSLKELCKGDVWDTLGTRGWESAFRTHFFYTFYYLDKLETPRKLKSHLPVLNVPDF